MKAKIYFDVEQITTIQLRFRNESDYVWVNELPEKRKYFLGFILYEIQKRIPAGWTDTPDYVRSYGTKPSSYFDKYDWYQVDEKAGKIYNKAYVTIHLGPKETVSQYFDSDNAAQEYVNVIIKKSGKKLEPVIVY